jgi:O-antigen ligase
MHANDLGLFFSMGFSFMLFTGFRATGRLEKIIFLFVTILAGLMAALTFSRGTFLGLGTVALYFFFTRRKFKQLITALILLIGVVISLPDAFIERASEGVTRGGRNELSAGRIDHIWLPLLPVAMDSPLIGHGLSSTLWAEPVRRGVVPPVNHPHSAYLATLLDFGLLGGFLVMAFFWSMWKLFNRLKNEHPEMIWRGYFEGALVCIIILAVQGMTAEMFVPSYSQTYLWLAYGMAVGFATKFGWFDKEDSNPTAITGISADQGPT